jgi:PIN domain nuclease of toxin-antitoxin system
LTAGINYFREVIPGGTSIVHGAPRRNPAGRILIAAARELAATLVTRDREIIAYGEQGNVSVVVC